MRAARRTDRYHWAWHRWARYVAQRLILRPIVFSTTRVTVAGEANLEGLRPPFVVVANHSSHLDAPLVITALPWRVTRHLATAVAADYFYRQAWRRTLTSFFFNSYPVERGRGKKREAGLSVTLLRENIPLAIFPEGTRSRTGEMAPFTPGAAALARALRVPLVPLALVGAHDAMPPGASWPKPGRLPVKVIIGKPIEARRGENLPDLNERLTTQVRQMLTNQTPYVLVPESAPSATSGHGEDQADDHAARGGDKPTEGAGEPGGKADDDDAARSAGRTGEARGDDPAEAPGTDGEDGEDGTEASGGRWRRWRRKNRTKDHTTAEAATGGSDDGGEEAGGHR